MLLLDVHGLYRRSRRRRSCLARHRASSDSWRVSFLPLRRRPLRSGAWISSIRWTSLSNSSANLSTSALKRFSALDCTTVQSRAKNIPAEWCYINLVQQPITARDNGVRCGWNSKTALDQTVVRETDWMYGHFINQLTTWLITGLSLDCGQRLSALGKPCPRRASSPEWLYIVYIVFALQTAWNLVSWFWRKLLK